MSVVTVTPNPALDMTYTVDHLLPGKVHRVTQVDVRPGGKGINVARVLTTLGVPVVVTGIIGGPDGAALRAAIRELGLTDALVAAEVDTRRTVTVVDREAGTATLFNEPGPAVAAAQWERLRERVVTALLPSADVVTISGSLPPGVPADALADLVADVRRVGVPVVVDTSGPALLAAIQAGPSAVKPNADELREVTGIDDPGRAAAVLHAETGATVVVSRGGDGLTAVTADGTWSAALPHPLTGNSTGAGDSVVAALALGLRTGWSWPRTLREACALSAATVLTPVAGEFDPAALRRISPTVQVEKVPT